MKFLSACFLQKKMKTQRNSTVCNMLFGQYKIKLLAKFEGNNNDALKKRRWLSSILARCSSCHSIYSFLHLNFGNGNQKEIPQCAFLGRLDKIRPRQWRSLEDIVMMPQKGVGAHPSLLGVAPAIYLLIAIATV